MGLKTNMTRGVIGKGMEACAVGVVAAVAAFALVALLGGCSAVTPGGGWPGGSSLDLASGRDPFTLVVRSSLATAANGEPTATAFVSITAPTPLLPLSEPDIATSTTKTADATAATATLKVDMTEKRTFWQGVFDGAWKFAAGLFAGSAL